MKPTHILYLLLAGLLLATGVTPMNADEPPREPLRMLPADGVSSADRVSSAEGAPSAAEREILLEWLATEVEIETVKRAGETCRRVILPGTVQATRPGTPQVPVRGALLGLPPGADTERVAVQIVPADWESLGRHRLCSTPVLRLAGDDERAALSVERGAPGADLYGETDRVPPHQPVELVEGGYLRDQAVVQLQFNPVGYNPDTGETRLYRRIVARVTWETSPTPNARATRWAGPDYERLLRGTLLN